LSLIEWNDNFSVGIEQFDNEHKQLIELVNKLHMSRKSGKGNEKIPELLSELTKYALKHFSAEEKLMTLKRYPFYEEHKRAHDQFSLKIVEYKKLHQQNLLHTNQLMTILRNWVITHICNIDKKYETYLK